MAERTRIHRGDQARIERVLDNYAGRRHWLRSLLEDIADEALSEMRRIAPVGSGYIQEHITKSAFIYMPGAPGGGGGYRLIVGVRRGSSLHPIYVHQGTVNKPGQSVRSMMVGGIGPSGSSTDPMPAGIDPSFGSQGRIYSTRQGGNLRLQKNGEPPRYRKWVTGQKPQPFVYFAFKHATVYSQGRVRSAINPLRLSSSTNS